ncbi:MAG: hypothetical protein KUG75_16450 [Pseudomonadales bacterium]|nr:hypothetical protein [Pseudomonadales bacterium]
MLKIAHIVNPLVVRNPNSDLLFAQPITLHTMSLARNETNTTDDLEVKQYAAFYTEDSSSAPADFETTAELDRSILDVVPGNDSPRKLPFLSDILDRLYKSAPDADYLIYSNIDIGLWPDFYQQVSALIREGYDAFVIGRRTLSTEFMALEELERIYAQEGSPHYGYSCFVFPRHHYPDYVLGDTCIGLQPVGVTLAINMIQSAKQYQYFGQGRYTFHLGDDRVWNQSLLDKQHIHNEQTLDTVVSMLKAKTNLTTRAITLLHDYQKWRCNYVILKTHAPLLRNIYRLLRKLGLYNWIAKRYTSSI